MKEKLEDTRVEDTKDYVEKARDLFQEHVDLDNEMHLFALILAVFIPTYVISTGQNPFAGIPLYQLVAGVVIFAVMWYALNGDGEIQLFSGAAPVEKQGSGSRENRVSPDEIQVHENR